MRLSSFTASFVLAVTFIPVARAEVFQVDMNGWGKVKWGMTKAQVQRAYPKAHEYESYPGGAPNFGLERFRFEDATFKVIFRFNSKTGGLENIHLFFNKDEPQPETDAVEDMKRHLEAQFTKVFGRPKITPLRSMTQYSWSAGTNIVEIDLNPEGPKKQIVHPSLDPYRPDSGRIETVPGKPATLTISLSKY